MIDVVPIPKRTTTLNSFTNPQKEARTSNGDSQFTSAKRLPSKKEIEKLIGIVISTGTSACMDNHIYTIDGQIRKQKQ